MELVNRCQDFVSASGGTFFISAKGYGQNIGNYKVNLTEKEIMEDDHDGNNYQSPVSVDGNVSGNIDFVGDEDYFP